ncbi:hypothetical protein VKS41_005111 [Umbelopsis sp. WA50703]
MAQWITSYPQDVADGIRWMRSKEGRTQRRTLRVNDLHVAYSDSDFGSNDSTYFTTDDESDGYDSEEDSGPLYQRVAPRRSLCKPMETSVVISGRPLKVIIDTRAGASIISMPLVKTLGHAMDKKNRINVQTVD